MMIVFALGFGSLAMLWGIAGASAPIIIHLLSRRKYREMEWAAMKWLLAALQKQARRIRLEQIILLAIRTLIILLIALAMSRPYLESAGVPLFSGSHTHRIVVIDSSLSMSQTVGDASNFEEAKQVALKVLSQSRQGDLASLIAMANPSIAVVAEASPNIEAVREEVESLQIQHVRADLSSTLTKLQEVIEASSVTAREVYFLTDLQRVTWDQNSGEVAQGIKQVVETIGDSAGVSFIDLGQEAPNLSVSRFELDAPVVIAGKQVQLSATVVNHAPSRLTQQEIVLVVNGDTAQRRTVELDALKSQEFSFSYTFENSGPTVVELRVGVDALMLDNSRWLALNVKDYVDVLVVDGEPSGRAFESESDYIRVALTPTDDLANERSEFRCEVVRESDLLSLSLDQYDCVIFANVAEFSTNDQNAIRQFLEVGGSVVFYLGDQINATNYNGLSIDGNEGFLPIRLQQPVGDARARQSVFRFDPREYGHPIVQAFRGAEQGGLLTASIFRYFKGEVVDSSDTTVAMSFDSGDPAIVTTRIGRGYVAVVTTSADMEWGHWPVSFSYVPVNVELVLQAIAGQNQRNNIRTGDAIALPIRPSVSDVAVSVVQPTGESRISRVTPSSQIRDFVFRQTFYSGSYRVSVDTAHQDPILFAANPDPNESRGEKMTERELNAMFPGWKLRYYTDSQALVAGQDGLAVSRGELYQRILLVVLGLLFLESFLAFKFGHFR